MRRQAMYPHRSTRHPSPKGGKRDKGLAVVLLLLILALPRKILAVFYLLYVPGYCLTAAFFPRKSDLDGIERLGLSLGLSLATITVLAILLDQLPLGIHLWTIRAAEYIATAAFAAIALRRRARLAERDAYLARPAWQPRSWWQSLSTFEHRLLLLSSGVLLTALLSSAWIMIAPAPKSFMTEFYILGPGGLAEGYISGAIPGDQIVTTVGITNRERDQHTYTIEIWIVDPWDSAQRTLAARITPITLSPGQSYERPIPWRVPKPVGERQFEFLLLDGENPEPYRRLCLWLHAPTSSSGREANY